MTSHHITHNAGDGDAKERAAAQSEEVISNTQNRVLRCKLAQNVQGQSMAVWDAVSDFGADIKGKPCFVALDYDDYDGRR